MADAAHASPSEVRSTDLSAGHVPPVDREFAEHRLRQEADRVVFRRVAFVALGGVLVVGGGVALDLLYRIIKVGPISSPETFLAAIVLAVPVIAALAMVRVAFGDSSSKSSEDESVSLLHALLKELLNFVRKRA